MLEAQVITSLLEQSLNETDMLAYAIVSVDGIVLESRERRTNPTDLFPQHRDSDENFSVSSKLQTKIYGLFAAEYWKQSGDAQWVGADAHERRLVIHSLDNKSLLLLVIGKSSQSWGEISRNAAEVAAQLHT